MLNKVTIIGTLGRDPEIRATQDGRKIANISVATSEKWKDKSGQRQERTEWHRVVLFSDALAGIAERYLRKGSKVYLEGKLQTRKWANKEGQDQYSTEIVLQGFDAKLIMLDGKKGQEPVDNSGGLDDDIPF